MRHSIIGERDGIDKERAEIGSQRFVEWGAVPRGCSGTAGLRGIRCCVPVCGIRMLANGAEKIQDQDNNDDGSDDAEPAAGAPARVTVIAAPTGEQKRENYD
jgi:hypothetical protein